MHGYVSCLEPNCSKLISAMEDDLLAGHKDWKQSVKMREKVICPKRVFAG